MATHENFALSPKSQILKNFYAALNSHDLPAIFELLDAEIEHIEFEGTPQAGRYSGLSEVKAHFTRARATWAEGSCTPKQFLDIGDRVVALVHVRVKLKENMEWVEGDVADVFTFRNDKLLQMRTFADKQQALSWAQQAS